MKAVYCVETEKKYETIAEAARELNVSPQHINAYLHGKTNTVKGYHFEYRERTKPQSSEALTDGATWKKVEGFPRYSVSIDGRVRNNKTWRILSAGGKRYLRVVLTENGVSKSFQVHRLVATAFIPNPENKAEVNHKDGNRFNNNASNLEWTSKSENMLHKCYVLGREPQMKAVLCVETGIIYPSRKAAVKAIGGDISGLRACLKGEQKTWKGFHWRMKQCG